MFQHNPYFICDKMKVIEKKMKNVHLINFQCGADDRHEEAPGLPLKI